MKIDLSPQINENPAGRAALFVVHQIQQAGYQALFVGGGVRDLLLHDAPHDFDIATAARPDVLTQLFPDSNQVGAKFGVFIIRREEFFVEVATFREEGEYNDRRRPDLVKFSSLDADARRRDFTVNALFYDPISRELKDLVGGVDDLKQKRLRCVGQPEERFKEDALRIMRGVRFAANLDFTIEQQTWQALCQLAPLTQEISIERVRDELIKGFTGAHPERFLDLLNDSGLLEIFLPEVHALHGCMQPPEFHPEGDVYQHTRLLLKQLKPRPSPELAMAVLLHDIGKPPTQTVEDRIRFNGHDKVGAAMADEICRRLRFSNRQIQEIATMVRRHMQFMNLPNMRKATLQRFLAEPTIEDELELHRVDCLASHGGLDTWHLAGRQLEEFHAEQSEAGKLPKPFVTGRDLIELGMDPGPQFAVILREIFDAQLEGQFASREEALQHLQNTITRK